MTPKARKKLYLAMAFVVLYSPFPIIISFREHNALTLFISLAVLGITLIAFGLYHLSYLLQEEKHALLRSYYKGDIQDVNGRKQ